MVGRFPIQPKTLATPFGVWTPAILCEGGSRMLFISGMVARGVDGKIVGRGDYGAQTRQVCENLKAAVEAVGGTLADIMQVTVFVCDIEKFSEIHAVRRRYFPSDPPASTMVEVSRLVDKEALIEINAIAVL
jgi:enamine deaminase RidA (YjgF/YER057c/UK114 family)